MRRVFLLPFLLVQECRMDRWKRSILSIKPFTDKYAVVSEKIKKLNDGFPELLKKSILQQAVMGKLVPQDENDEPASILLDKIRSEKEALIKAGKIKKDKCCKWQGSDGYVYIDFHHPAVDHNNDQHRHDLKQEACN